jgi:hypothetical protein
MAVDQTRGPRPAAGGSATVRDEDGQPVAASVDGLLARVAHGGAEAFAALYDQVADAVHGAAAERLRGGSPGAGQPPGIPGGSAGGNARQRARPGRRTGLPQTRGKEGHRA